ncbi:hypothetical protein TSUD_195150 [Trifolium subterraneum]|nr:hypothetical protein TSUD_195150 [Trifolium subterraneum]
MLAILIMNSCLVFTVTLFIVLFLVYNLNDEVLLLPAINLHAAAAAPLSSQYNVTKHIMRIEQELGEAREAISRAIKKKELHNDIIRDRGFCLQRMCL